MKKERSGLTKLLDAAVVLYFALRLFDYLLSRAWGAFLIVTGIATVGWAVPLTYFDYYCLGREKNGEDVGVIWITALICGAVTAYWQIYGKRPAKMGGKRRSFRLWRKPNGRTARSIKPRKGSI